MKTTVLVYALKAYLSSRRLEDCAQMAAKIYLREHGWTVSKKNVSKVQSKIERELRNVVSIAVEIRQGRASEVAMRALDYGLSQQQAAVVGIAIGS